MAKPQLEFTDSAREFQREPVPGEAAGLREKILSRDAATGDCTRLLRFPAGFRGAEPLMHDFWEEVWIVEGSLRDLSLDQTFFPGHYACRPPGMRHGPYQSADGCVLFEVRYYTAYEAVRK